MDTPSDSTTDKVPFKEHLTEVEQHYAEVARKSQEEDSLASPCSLSTEHADALDKQLVKDMGWDVAEGIHGSARIQDLPTAAVSACRGCADSVSKAVLKQGEVVLDLGCGGGADALIAAEQIGSTGFVYGLDMTDAMLDLATANAEQAGCTNTEFIKGHIEDIPLPEHSINVVLSNCVLNFSADKAAALREAYRVLKPGGRIVISDIVALKEIPTKVYDAYCRFVGCTNGMCSLEEYETLFKDAGFVGVSTQISTVYTIEALEEKAIARGREAQFFPLKRAAIDGVSGSVLFEAIKPL